MPPVVNALSGIMTSVSKSQKVSQEVNSRQFRKRFEDRITNLPSSLQTKILSCLSTKDAVRTSILARKWKRSWSLVTNLDFDDKLDVCRRDDENKDIMEEKFFLFVNRVLLLRERSSLQRFRMNCSGRYKGSLVNTWIAAVLHCHVQELDVSVLVKYPTLLTSDIFTCKTLVVLKLDVDGNVNLPTSVDLPHLKTLHLANLEFLDEVSIENLLSGCPVLEDLNLRWCIGNDVCVVNVIAPALTNLTLENLPYDDERSDVDYSYDYRYDYWYEIMLDTPALKFLNLNDYGARGYVVRNLNRLTEAVITVGAPYEDIYGNYTESIEIRSRAITDLFNGISQVQSLVLSDDSMRAIHLCDPALPIFNNLTCLELSTTRYTGWRCLPKLLKNSPCLETLYLHKRETGYEWVDEDYFSTDEVPSSFLSHLKVIKIDNFEGLPHDMEMVGYFLENAKVLEKLTIVYRPAVYSPMSGYENIEEKDNFYNKLLMRRCSNVCKIEVL